MAVSKLLNLTNCLQQCWLNRASSTYMWPDFSVVIQTIQKLYIPNSNPVADLNVVNTIRYKVHFIRVCLPWWENKLVIFLLKSKIMREERKLNYQWLCSLLRWNWFCIIKKIDARCKNKPGDGDLLIVTMVSALCFLWSCGPQHNKICCSGGF